MKRLLAAIFCMLFCGVCNSAQIVNVEYIHKLIEQQYGITVPYNSNLTNPHVAANMKYLLTTIDAANSILNGEQITDYGNGAYATTVATDTVATLEMVRDHIRNYKFFATTTPDTTSFNFTISASGVFHIDWGDGTRESYRKNNTTTTTYSHKYATAGEYVIKIGGYRTGGKSLSFQKNLNLAKIDGSLGAIFSTIKKADGTLNQTSFRDVFNGCTKLTGEIPPELFKGIYGQPTAYMFWKAFMGCSGLTGAIPDGLFGDLYGQPADGMFGGVFHSCSGLTGEIPENLFGNLYGTTRHYMFGVAFYGCSGLTGKIPDRLFGELSGGYKGYMFYRLFDGCSGLTGSIPAGLFGNLSGKAHLSPDFKGAFNGCRRLTGEIPENLFGDIYGAPVNDIFSSTFSGCSGLTGSIPNKLFGNLSGVPAANMFHSTFSGCSGLTGDIPADLFGNISGDAQDYMFVRTFSGCSKLTGDSPKINGQHLYEIWPDATSAQVGSMYRGATGLTDYADIPSNWK